LEERTFSKSTRTISLIPGKRNNATTEKKGEKKTRKKKEKKTPRQREETREKRHGHKREKGRKEDGSKSRQGVETAVPEAILHFFIACL
jgi:hypothetical protein